MTLKFKFDLICPTVGGEGFTHFPPFYLLGTITFAIQFSTLKWTMIYSGFWKLELQFNGICWTVFSRFSPEEQVEPDRLCANRDLSPAAAREFVKLHSLPDGRCVGPVHCQRTNLRQFQGVGSKFTGQSTLQHHCSATGAQAVKIYWCLVSWSHFVQVLYIKFDSAKRANWGLLFKCPKE